MQNSDSTAFLLRADDFDCAKYIISFNLKVMYYV